MGFAPPPRGGLAYVVDVSSLLCVNHGGKYLGYQAWARREGHYGPYPPRTRVRRPLRTSP
jgi:hypothetical protein